jgi:hypothetical protein
VTFWLLVCCWVQLIWPGLFARHGGKLAYDFDLSTLAQLSEGYAAGGVLVVAVGREGTWQCWRHSKVTQHGSAAAIVQQQQQQQQQQGMHSMLQSHSPCQHKCWLSAAPSLHVPSLHHLCMCHLCTISAPSLHHLCMCHLCTICACAISGPSLHHLCMCRFLVGLVSC